MKLTIEQLRLDPRLLEEALSFLRQKYPALTNDEFEAMLLKGRYHDEIDAAVVKALEEYHA